MINTILETLEDLENIIQRHDDLGTFDKMGLAARVVTQLRGRAYTRLSQLQTHLS
jgi:hypothetical protein